MSAVEARVPELAFWDSFKGTNCLRCGGSLTDGVCLVKGCWSLTDEEKAIYQEKWRALGVALQEFWLQSTIHPVPPTDELTGMIDNFLLRWQVAHTVITFEA